ncbi:hypothetical protein J4444_05255 [Candidatus Woesearchaeota archaeon]|nr:hypothetical protein [Candidatus Woesearchaeota archaeon]
MVGVLGRLDRDTRDAVGRVAAQWKVAKDLEADLVRIQIEPKGKVKDSRYALNLLKWVGRAEKRIDRSEQRIIVELDEITKLGLPPGLLSQDQQLAQKLQIQERELLKLASQFVGKIRTPLREIMLDEQLLERHMKEPALQQQIQHALIPLVGNTRVEVVNLLRWIASTQAVLKQIEGFDRVLMKLAR